MTVNVITLFFLCAVVLFIIGFLFDIICFVAKIIALFFVILLVFKFIPFFLALFLALLSLAF